MHKPKANAHTQQAPEIDVRKAHFKGVNLTHHLLAHGDINRVPDSATLACQRHHTGVLPTSIRHPGDIMPAQSSNSACF